MRTTKRTGYTLAAVLPFVAVVMVSPACDDETDDHDGDACLIGDPSDGHNCECTGNDCVCPSSGDCAIYCVDDCSLQCAGSGSCDFLCSLDCAIECTGSGNCDLDVGPNSTVACTGSGDCDIDCNGDCSVSCPGSATCTVHCDPDPEASCTLDNCPSEVQECPDNILVCNGGCS